MKKRTSNTVILQDGTLGTIDAWHPGGGTGAYALVRVGEGSRLWVPADTLVPQADGSYRLPVDQDQIEKGEVVIPVLVEDARLSKKKVETGTVRLRKVVHTREEIVTPNLTRERVYVERVPVGRAVDGPVATRQEGDTFVVPVLEEVLAIEKRLVLIEEVRVTVRREPHASPPQRVLLRREEVVVERDPRGPAKASPDHH